MRGSKAELLLTLNEELEGLEELNDERDGCGIVTMWVEIGSVGGLDVVLHVAETCPPGPQRLPPL